MSVRNIADDLHSLIIDKNICFVGVQLRQKLEILKKYWKLLNIDSIGVELGYLAASILKKPILAECIMLKSLAEAIGIDFKLACIVQRHVYPDWSAGFLLHDVIKLAIQDAYSYYSFGKTILARYISIPFLSKMGIYDVEVKPGVTIKTRVLDNADVVDTCISQFKSSIAGNGNVVGLDVKMLENQICPNLLIFCAGSQCLVIQHPLAIFPDSVKQLLTDKTICFVGIELSKKLKQNWLWKNIHYTLPPIGVELSYLAANVLKKPTLGKCLVLKELADEVCTDYKVPEDTCVDWGAYVFSHDEVKHAMHEAYTCYDLAKSLLGKL